MNTPAPVSLSLMVSLIDGMAHAAVVGVRELKKRGRRRPAHLPCRQPGQATPMWNALVANLRLELEPYGTQARLARYLGLPRQRIHDFLRGNRRLPDAETTLRLIHWVCERRAGRDPSL